MQQSTLLKKGIAIGLLCLLLTGCAGQTASEDAATESADNAAVQTIQTTEQKAPFMTRLQQTADYNIPDMTGFQAQDLDGNAVDASIFADHTLTMVNVWTTWCSPCIEEMPSLETLRGKLADEGIQLVSILADAVLEGETSQEAVQLAQEIRDKANVQYPIILPDETLCQGTLKELTAYPVTFFVDSTGKVVGNSYLGARDLDEFLAIALQELTALSDKQQP